MRIIYPNTFSGYVHNFYKKSNTFIEKIISKLNDFLNEYNEKNKVRIALVNDFEHALNNKRINLQVQ
jgi:hypothetical protein